LKIVFLPVFLLLTFFAGAQPGCPSVDAGTDQIVTCASNCANLSASVLATGATNSYSVSSIPYAPPYSYSAGTPLLVNIDDTWSSVLNMPFTFCYFGTPYTQCVAGSNGLISFDLTYAGGYCQYPYTASCPSSSIPLNSIFGPYHDIDPAVTGDMYWATYGSYPCRTLVVSWNQVAMFSCTTLIATHMIVLYETTNVIEVYIENKPLCASWNSGNAVVGIQDAAGTTGYTAPGRQTGQWIASNEAWRFTPNGTPNYAVTWWQGATQIASGLTTTVCPVTNTTYTAKAVYTNCDATQVTVTDNMNVNINTSMPVSVSPASTAVCAGSSATLTASGGTSYSWSNSGSGTSITVTPASTTTYTVTATLGICTNTANATVTVNSAPPADAGLPQSICSGQSATLTASGGGTYQWNTGPTTASINVTPGTTTTYTVTVTAAGCTASDNVTVTVNSPPVADAGLPQTICPSATATLTATGGGTYQWNTGPTTQSINVSPAVTTTYTVTVTNLGCTASDNVTVFINASITADAGLPQTICNGQSATLTATGGSTYQWAGGPASASYTVSPTSTTTYTVTAYSGGCSGTDDVIVTVNPLPAADAGLPQTICIGQSASLTATGGGTYLWDTGPSTATISVTPASTTTYTVTVTNLGCSASDNVAVNVNPLPIADAGLPQTICPGSSATLTATGGGIYQWNTGPTTSSISVSPVTTTSYSVTVTNLGCTASDDVTISVNTGITADAGLPQTICSGQSATLTATGGSSYVWSNSASGASISVSPVVTTTYTVTASSGGCSGTDDVVITVSATPVANAGTDQIICMGQSANLTAFGGGTYLWSNTSTNQSTNVSPLTTTSYIVTVTSASGCSSSDNVTVNVNSLPPANAGPDQSICYGNSANLIATGGVGYTWNPTASLSNPNVPNPIANPVITTSYSVTVTDINGCSASDVMVLNIYPQVSANAGPDQTICNGQSANLLATGGTNYLWSPAGSLSNASIPNPVASPVSSTTYTVTVSDANGCSSTDDVAINVNTVPTSDFTLTSPICIGGYSSINYTGTASPLATYNWDFSTGIISSGNGQGPYQVSWSTAGSYNVSLSVTENGCTSTSTIIPQIVGYGSVSLAVTDSISCFGAADGQVTATAFGLPPYQYNWSNPQIGPIAINLSAAIPYSVTVTDANGCSASQSITLNEPQALTINFVSQHVSCNGGNNGVAVALISGGTLPYTYSWLPAGTAGNTNSVTTLSAGTYTFMASDAHGCTIDTTFTITEPPVLAYSYITDSVNCFSGNDGSIAVTTNGGSPPYAYTWSPLVSTGPTATSLPQGAYQLTITDHNGCNAFANISVYEPPQLVLTNSGNVSICDGQFTTITAGATGGTGTYTFTWDNGLGNGNSFSVNPTTTTTYSISVVDGNLCSVPPQSLTVSVSPPISIALTSTPTAMCLGNSAVLTATANGGNGNFIYTWGQGIGISTSAITVTPTGTTTYPVTVTDNCGSPQDADSVQVTIYPLPNVLFSSDTINGCEPLSINFSDNTTPAISSWQWNFGDPLSGGYNNSTIQDPVHIYAEAGTYTVSLDVVTTDGCAGNYVHQNMIEVYPTPIAAFVSAPAQTTILNPIIQFADMSSGASYWSWNFGDFATNNDNISSESSPYHYFSNPGNYTVTLIVTSDYGCIDSVSNVIVIDRDFTFYAPNAFSPDGNGKNDFFFPQGEGWDPQNYQFYIFDRWGGQIFKTNNTLEYWDGRVNGGSLIAPQGVYVWTVYVRDFNGEPHTFNGHVTLLRK